MNQNDDDYYDVSSVITDENVIDDFISMGHNPSKLAEDEGVEFAIQDRYIEIVENLVQQGAISIQDLMSLSIYKGQFKILKFALKQGADLHTNINYYLLKSIHGRNNEMIKFLLQQHANNFNEVLKEAAGYGNTTIVKLLVEEYNANNLDEALEKAVYAPNSKTVEYLLEKGANINILHNSELQKAIVRNGGYRLHLYLESKGIHFIDPKPEMSSLYIMNYLIEEGEAIRTH